MKPPLVFEWTETGFLKQPQTGNQERGVNSEDLLLFDFSDRVLEQIQAGYCGEMYTCYIQNM